MLHKNAILAALPLAGCLFIPTQLFAQDSETSKQSTIPANFRLSSGISYSKGDYGELEDTEVVAIPVSLTYSDSGFKVRVSVPYVYVNGPGSLLSTPEGRDGGGQGRGRGRGGDSGNSGSGSLNSGSGSSGSEVEVEDEAEDEVIDDDDIIGDDGIVPASNSRKGIGDVNVSLGYSLALTDTTYFEPEVKVKLPTASRSKRLGTGKVDVTAAASLVQDFGPASVYVGARRKFAGKPDGSTIRSTWGAGGGASVRAAQGVAVGADYDWQQSSFAGRQASSEVTGWANFRVRQGLSMTAYAGTGLNDNSAKFFGGVSLSSRF